MPVPAFRNQLITRVSSDSGSAFMKADGLLVKQRSNFLLTLAYGWALQ